MRRIRVWVARLSGLLGGERREKDLAEEMESHVQMHAEDNVRAGMSPGEARREAMMKLGGVEQAKEMYRDRRGLPRLETLWRDLIFAGRMLRKNPGASLIMVFTLALGMGATTAIFSVVYGVLLRPLPYPRPDRIVAIWEVNRKGRRMNFADPNFDDIRAQNHSLQAMAEYASGVEAVSGGSEPSRVGITSVSRDFFAALGVQPVLGRGFAAEDQREGAARVALVSYNYWRQSLGGSTDLSQYKLRIQKQVYSVVGVLPPGFRYPGEIDIWTPRELDSKNRSRTAHNWHGIGRLRDGVTLAQARADLSGIARGIGEEHPEGQDYGMRDAALSPLQEALTSRVGPTLWVLLGTVGFLLLVACANVANLLLSQAAARGRELAIRSALGAGRRRLVMQFFTEALLLAMLGGSLGAIAARWGVDGLLAFAPRDLPRLDSIGVSVPVLLFALGISMSVAVGLGILTALRATSGDLREALIEGGRTEAGGMHSQRVGNAIATAQLAITLVLLIGAGLLGRSLLRLLSVDPGFRTERIVTMDLSMPEVEDAASKSRQAALVDTLFARLRAIPGVEDVGAASSVPLEQGFANGMFVLLSPQEVPKRLEDFEQLVKDASRTGDADYCAASEGYFRVFGIPLVRGRMFDERDGMNAPHAAVISESLARMKWPNQDPLGRTIEFGNMDGDLRLLTIVGVVGDVRQSSLETAARPTIYVNLRQRPRGVFTVVLRAEADAAPVISAARGILRDLAPDVPPRFRAFSQLLNASLGARRFDLTLVGVFAVTALLLALAGVYGVMAYSVTRRTREIGVRMALGATPADVLRMVLGRGMLTAAVGVAIGVAGSLALTRTIKALLFGVSATDPATFAGVALLLAGMTLAACYIPARRAMRVDPMVALRHE